VKLNLPDSTGPVVRVSLNGELLLYSATDPKDVASAVLMTIAPIGGGPAIFARPYPPGIFTQAIPTWSPDGLAIDIPITRGGVGNVWRQPINGGAIKQLTNFTSLGLTRFAWSPDGKTLFTVRGSRNEDIILLQTQKAQ
jgi:WD40-like Beta Propeller Repeat